MTNNFDFPFTVKGEPKHVGRVITPFHSLNKAVSGSGNEEFGFPTNTWVEIGSPKTGIGKTHFVSSLAGYMCNLLGTKGISYLDLEGQDPNIIYSSLKNSGFTGVFEWVGGKSESKKDNTDEQLLDALIDSLYDDQIGVLDSIATVAGVSEQEGDIGDANMGRARSFPMAQFSRRVARALRVRKQDDIPTVLFTLNHSYPKIGAIGFAKQYDSPGGEVKNNLEQLNIRTEIPYVDYLSTGDTKKSGRFEDDGAWIMKGTVQKNRSGAFGAEFQVFIYGGKGVHVGMSAVIDCLAGGLAEVKSGGKVVMDGQDFGLLSKIVANKADDVEFFKPFMNELKVTQVDTASERDEE